MKNYRLIVLLLLIPGVNLLFGQDSPLIKADKEFELKNYSRAVSLYQSVLESGKENFDRAAVMRKMGDSYNEMNDYLSAIKYYESFLNINKNDNDIKFKNAEMTLRSGNVKRALEIFTELSLVLPDDKEVKRMILSCHKAIEENQASNIYPIKEQNLINSEQSEFGLAFFENMLIFASSRITNEFSSIHKRTNQGYSDFYGSKYDSVFQMYNHPEKLNWALNTNNNEGTFAYNPESKLAYYTQCEPKPGLCRIFMAKWNNGKWSDIKQILSNQPAYDLAHPALSANMKTIYFSSNLPGGFGGKDIWKAPVLIDGHIGIPVNLGNTINTAKDEMFPSVVGDSILLFSSQGMVGLGGLDIYSSKFKDELFDQPINLGMPINSSSDDFSILLNPDARGGYFCSNRNNVEKSDDIYAFSHNIFFHDLRGKVIDLLTFKPLSDAKITYYEKNAPNKIIYTDAQGNFEIPNSAHALCKEKHYIIVEKDKYLPNKMEVPCFSEKEIVVLMDDGSGVIHSLEGIVVDKKTKKPVSGVKVTLKSLKKLDLETVTGSDGEYNFQGVVPDDFISLRATKDGYLTDSKSLMTPIGKQSINISPVTGFDTGFGLYPIEKNVEFKIENIYYEFDKATLLPQSKTSLNKLVNILMENPQVLIKINSHTDNRGNVKYNLALSTRRGESVVKYLTKAGIRASRLNSQGYGESKPEIPNAKKEEQHQLNRRTTFEIVGQDNKVLLRSDKPGDKPASVYLSSSQLLKIIEDAKNEGKVIDEAFLMDLKLKMGLGDAIVEKKVESEATLNEPIVKATKKIETVPEKLVETVKITEPQPSLTGPAKDEILPLGNEFYRVQIAATSTDIDLKEKFKNSYDLIQKYGVTVVPFNNLKKYQLGNFTTRQEAVDLKSLLLQRGLKQTFIITIKK